MELTYDFQKNILNPAQPIEDIEVVYKKNKKYRGPLLNVTEDPFKIIISDDEKKEDSVHTIDFDAALQITVKYSDDSFKVYQDIID